MVADLDGEGIAVGEWDVRRVRDYDVELLLCDRGEEIAVKKADLAGDAVAVGVLAGNGHGWGGEVDGGDPRIRQVVSESDGDAAGAGANVRDARRWKAGS